MNRDQAQAFFTRYGDAFSAGNGDAVAELWHTPSSLADTRDGVARVTCWNDEAAMRANMVALCEVYRGAGEHVWTFDLREHVPLGANHAFCHVAWTMTRGAETVQSFATGYQLGRLATDGWRVLFCTAYQEDISEIKNHAAA